MLNTGSDNETQGNGAAEGTPSEQTGDSAPPNVGHGANGTASARVVTRTCELPISISLLRRDADSLMPTRLTRCVQHHAQVS